MSNTEYLSKFRARKHPRIGCTSLGYFEAIDHLKSRDLQRPPGWTWMHPSGSSSTSAKLSHKKRLLDIYHKNQNLHSTSVNCFRKKQRLNIYQRNKNLHCCHQFLLATRETGFILFLSKFWLSVSSPASHPKAEFALLPSKLANTKVRIHIVAIEVVTFRF